jgi:hypothetical protein
MSQPRINGVEIMIPYLPGWDSLPTVTRYHNWAEMAGIIAVAVLVIAEVIQYKYGHRRDDLIAREQIATNKHHDEEMARLHLKTAQTRERAANAELELGKIKAPRTLRLERQQEIARRIKPFARQRYRAAISQAADDGLAFWESLYATLESASWVYIPAGTPSMGNPPAGIPIAAIPGVEIRFDPARREELTPAALALGTALRTDGMAVAVNTNKQSDQNEADRDIFLIVIGARVPSP